MADLQAKLAPAWNWRRRRGLETRLMGLDVRMRREAARKSMGKGMKEHVGVGLM